MSPVSEADRRSAFEDLVLSAYEPLLRYLRRRTDAATADEVLGDVLLVLWRRFDDVPTDDGLPWCFGVARGCLANRVRADSRRLRLVRRLAETAAVESSPEHGDLHEALASLPAKDREVLRLWAWEQLPPREIAIVLGITPNAASIRLHRATRRLRSTLGARKSPVAAGHLQERQGTEVER